MNESITKQLLNKDQIDSIISDCLKLKWKYQAILEKIKSLSPVLSDYDKVYIGKKYSELLIELWLIEAPENVDLSDPKNFKAVLSTLSSIKSFQECCSLIGKSKYHGLVCDFTKQSEFLKKQETKCVQQLKRACLYRIQQHTDCVKCEILFLSHLGRSLKLSKNPKNLCDKIQLTDLIFDKDFDETNFRQFLLRFKTIDSNDKQILSLKHLACELLGVHKYYLIHDLKETVSSYLKEVEVNQLSCDGREVLEVSGTHIALGTVLPKIERQPRFSQIDEVRFVNCEVVHVDADLISLHWHGKNIVLYSKLLIVDINRLNCWDVSGRNGTEPQRDGRLSGADGNDGESGGSVLIVADNLINGKNLIIISNGGNGSKGQDGRSGKDGKDGESLSNYEFEQKYPPVSKYRDSDKIACLRITYDNVIDELLTVEDLNLGDLHIGPVEGDRFKELLDKHVNGLGNIYFEVTKTNGCKIKFSFYNRPLVPFSNCHSFLLLKGSPGSEGEAGGRGGRGGRKGFAGDINIHIKEINNDKCIQVHNEDGEPGKNGKSGNNGVCGKSGLDKAYMDISFSAQQWPVMFLPSEHDSSTLKVDYKQIDTGTCVYTLFGLYAEIIRCKKEIERNHYAKFDSEFGSSQYHQASRKKTISLQDTMDRYGQKITSANLCELSFCVEETMQMVDISIEETKLQQVAEEITVKRVCKRSSKLNGPQFWFKYELNASIDQVSSPEKPQQDLNTLLKLVEEDPTKINNWTNLEAVKMDFEQLEHLWTTSLRLHVGENCDSFLFEYVKRLLCNKLELSVIKQFDMQHSPSLTSVFCLKAKGVELIMNNTCSVIINSKLLCPKGVKFFCEDTLENRSDAKDICKLYTNGIQSLTILKTCFEELTSYCAEYPDLKRLIMNRKRFKTHKQDEINLKFCPVKRILMLSKDIQLYQMLVDGVVNKDRDKLFEVDKSITYSPDVLLNKLHPIYCEAVKRNFNWDANLSVRVIKQLSQLLYKITCEKGPLSKCYREIMAHHFDINIIIYSESDIHGKIKIVDNHNPQSTEKIHLLMKENKMLLINTNDGAENLIKTLKGAGKFNCILHHVGSLTEFHQFDEFLISKPFMAEDYVGIERSNAIKVKIKHILSEDDDLKSIKDRLYSKEDKIVLSPRLEKLKMEYIGYGSIIHFMALHFKEDGNATTTMELAAITNFVMQSSTDASYLLPVISWIIAAHSQNKWLIEIVLLKLTIHFKKEVDCDLLQKWRTYFSKLNVKEGLVLICEKIGSFNENNGIITVELLEEVFYLMSRTPNSHIDLNDIDICEWVYYLKDKYWMHQLSTVTNWTEVQLNSISYFLLSLENSFGMETCKKLLDILKLQNISPSERIIVENTFRELACSEMEINEKLINSLSKASILQWQEVLKKNQTPGVERSVPQLLDFIKEYGNTSKGIQSRLGEFKESSELINQVIGKLEENIKDVHGLTLWISCLQKTLNARRGSASTLSKMKSLFYTFAVECSSRIKGYLRLDFKQVNFNGDYTSLLKDVLAVGRNCDGEADSLFCYILIATVFLAIGISTKKKLRDTQKLAILMFIMSDTNILGQVSTGEGKSLIIVSVAIIKFLLKNHTVDIITSSHVLARRDADEYKAVYKLFNVSVGHNCSDKIEERKKNYSNCQIVYGELANFQRDYLLDRFYDKNVLGDRKFESVIVDEVDSMLIDQSSNVLYLSHDIPDLDKLEPVFVYIWKWLNIPGRFNQSVPSVRQLKESVLFDIFGWLNKDQIRHLDTSISDEQVSFTWERLISKNFISEKGQLLKHEIEDVSFIHNEWVDCIPEEHLKYLMTKLIKRDKQLEVPNHLKPFVLSHIDEWIKSAFSAISMENNKDYVVDINRSSSNSDCNPNIIILDHDTGTDLTNSHWDGGLHQFLQLKHGCRLSLLSLKAVFISNISYFCSYVTLYGLTGTLGSPRERDLLKDVYKADFVTIATSKPKCFVEYTPLICSTEAEWTETILKQAYDLSLNRSTLLICESVDDAIKLEQKFNEFLCLEKAERKIVTYKRDYDQLKVAERLKPGYIIISTNLAGRGTDIKLSEKLIRAGGLHVCLTFLPSNRRVEEQAYGRVARNGVPGSAQTIFLNHNPSLARVVEIKKLRDVNEYLRLLEMKKDYENKIKLEEQNFQKFEKEYESLKKMKQPKEIKTVLLQECINQWAFWLDHSNNNKSASSIISFLNGILNLHEKDVEKLVKMVKNPSSLIKMGLFYIKEKQFKNAISALNIVIYQEPHFSGIARYYRLFAESMEEDLGNDYVIDELQLVKKQLKRRIDSLLVNMEIVDRLKLHDLQSNLQYESFKEQQKNMAKMYLVFTESIDNIIGPNIDKIFLDTEHILCDLAEDEFVIKMQISSSVAMEELAFVKEYGLDPKKVFAFFKSAEGTREFNLKKFVDAFPLPSRELFWNELVGKNILINEEKYIMIDMKQLSDVDPSLKRRIEMSAIAVGPDAKHQVWLYRQEEIEGKFGRTLFDAKSICEAAGQNIMKKLEDQTIVMTNKRATLTTASDNHHSLSFTSIGNEDFVKLSIGENAACGILVELTEMQILNEKMICGKQSFSMMAEINDLRCKKLSKYSNYTCDVKGLLYFHFAFHFALKHLIHQLYQGEVLTIPLQMMPHNGIVSSLVECEVIKTVLAKEKNFYVLFSEDMSKEGWEKLFEKRYEPEISARITKYLIEKHCLDEVPWSFTHLPLINNRKYRVKTDKQGQINFPTPVNSENESIKLTIKHGIKLTIADEYETIKLLIQQQKDKKTRMKKVEGLITKVKNSGFSLTPLADILKRNDFSTTELNIFSLNGFDQVLNIGEKKWSVKMKLCVSITTMVGVAQIGIGAALALTAVGLPLSEVLIQEGISDLVYSMSCCVTGLFSWTSYLLNKVMSVTLSFAAGIGKLFSSIFGMKSVVKTASQTMETTGVTSTKIVAKALLPKREMIKTISARVATSVSLGVIYNTLPNIIEPHCQKISDFLVDLLDLQIEEALNNHVIVNTIKTLRCLFEKETCEKIMECALLESLSGYATERDYLDRNITHVVGILCGAISTIQEIQLMACEPQLFNPLSAMCSLNLLAKSVIGAIQDVKEGEFKGIRCITTMLMDDLDRRLCCIIETEKNELIYNHMSSGHQYSKDELRKLRNMVKADLSCLVKEKVISQFICSLGECILQQFNKSFLANSRLSKLQFPDHNKLVNINAPCLFKFGEYDELIKSKNELIANEADFEIKLNRKYKYLDLEYDHCLLKMFQQKGNCELFAEIVEKNLVADSSCLKVCCIVIPALLKSHGIPVHGLEIILHNNMDSEKYCTASCSKSELTTVYMIHDGNIESTSNQNNFLIQDVFEASRKVLSKKYPEFSWNPEKMLQEILYAVKHNVKIREFMYACQKVKMEKTFNDVHEPKLSSHRFNSFEYPYPKGKWKLNRSQDVDLRHALNISEHPANRVASHINNGFFTALTKVNDHIYKVQSHIKLPFKLTLEDFNATEIEITPPTNWPPDAPFECQFNRYELIVPFKDGSNELVDFNISLSLKNDRKYIQPHSPQGPHIVYEIKPQNYIRHISMGVKGHILLNDKCIEYSTDDCHTAGDLVLPSNFQTFLKKKVCDILVLGDSVLKFIPDYVHRPLCEVLICKDEINDFVTSEIQFVPCCYTGIKCVVLHIGKSVVRRQIDGKVIVILREIVEELRLYLNKIKIFVCAMHLVKNTEQFYKAKRYNARIVKLNSAINACCTLMRLDFVDTNDFIMPDDLRTNGIDLNRRGLMKLGKCIDNLSIDS